MKGLLALETFEFNEFHVVHIVIDFALALKNTYHEAQILRMRTVRLCECIIILTASRLGLHAFRAAIKIFTEMLDYLGRRGTPLTTLPDGYTTYLR